MASSLDNSAWLQWMQTLMGGVSRHTYAATLPPDRFYCLLDELPIHLIPQRARQSTQIQGRCEQPLFLNPDCILCTDGKLPDELKPREETFSGFALQGTIVWVRNLATGNLLPFWLGPKLENVVRSLHPNQPAPLSIPPSLRGLLAAAEILVPEGGNNRHQIEIEQKVTHAGPLFRQKGYAPLRDLIHPFHIAALRRYYRHLIRSGAISLGDGQSPRRYVSYNESVARFFHQAITPMLSAVAGEILQPSYVYMASYLSGAELQKHTDRKQCEFSITLCLDFSPEPALETPWPIRLDTPSGLVTVYQALGDGLAYRGTRLPHYRDKLSDGQTSTSIFFHYVSADFRGSLD
jgi:hypothetical protein